VGSLPDEVTLELSERPEDVEHELAAAGRGVDLFLQGPEANASLLQLFDLSWVTEAVVLGSDRTDLR